MNTLTYVIVIVVTVMMSGGTASAATFYGNGGVFDALLTAPTTVNFGGIAPINFYYSSDGTSSTLTVGSLDFSDGPTSNLIPQPPLDDSRDQNLLIVDPGFSQGEVFPWAVFGLPVLNDNKNPSVINVTPHDRSVGFLAAGLSLSLQGLFDGMNLVTVTDIGTITLSDGEFATFSLDSSVESFIGFTSTSPISGFTISTPAFGLLTSFVDYSSQSAPTSPTPEPRTAVLIGSVLLLLTALRQRGISPAARRGTSGQTE